MALCCMSKALVVHVRGRLLKFCFVCSVFPELGTENSH